MKILKDLLTINQKDVYEQYGAFLTESAAGEHSNYDALLTPPRMKPYVAVSFREEDGEKLPDVLPDPKFEPRDVTLFFAIIGSSKADWINKYNAFLKLLKSGWLDIRVPELGKTFRMYYKESSAYEQLTPFGEGSVISRFRVLLREPVPGGID